ncbi:efflux RND transporter permease subunit [Methylophilaceae bacterium]|nr:efflux RND transporter permease subunit [Methylophilaceae bacterium]MDC1011330.1 efflux RND transporter permease subunit [Methylophilaceae bacterium]
MTLPEISIRRHVLAWMISGIFVLFGIISVQKIGLDRFPMIEFPILSVTTTLEGANPEIIDASITNIIEGAVNATTGIESIKSSSSPGVSVVTITFNLDKDIEVAFNEIQSKVGQVARRLPDDIVPPVVRKVETNSRPIMWLGFTGDRTIQQLNLYARNILKKQLETIDGVGEVRLGGRRDRTIRINLLIDKMSSLNITANDVVSAFNREHLQLPGGYLVKDQSEKMFKLDLEYHKVKELNQLVIAYRSDGPVKIKDIAQVEDGLEDFRETARFNSNPSVGLGIVKVANSNTVDIINKIKYKLENDIRPNLPPGVTVKISTDDSIFIKSMVKSLQNHILEGTLLAALVVLLFLMSLRSTFIISVAIPISLLGAIAVMYFFGFTFNSMTLLALILLIGVVVDDAIVVLENIFRHNQQYKTSPFDSAINGSKEVVFAILASTLALVCIFAPVIYMDGIIGRFFESFAVVVTAGILVSFLVSLTLTPMLCSKFLVKETAVKNLPNDKSQANKIKKGMQTFFVSLEKLYAKILRKTLNNRWKVLFLSLLVVLSSSYFFSEINKELVPETDESRFTVRFKTPLGSNMDYTYKKLLEIEDKIYTERNNIASVFSSIGLGSRGQVNSGYISVRLIEKDKRKNSQSQIIKNLREEFNGLAGVKAFPAGVSIVGGLRSEKLKFSVIGPSIEKVSEYSNELQNRLAQIPDIGKIDLDLQLNLPQLILNIDRDKATSLGISARNIAESISVLSNGLDVARFNDFPGDGQRYEIRLKAKKNTFKDAQNLNKIYLRSKNGELVRLDTIAQFDEVLGPAVIGRESLQYSANFYTDPTMPLGEAIGYVNSIGSEILPTNFKIKLDGQAKEFAKTTQNVLFVFMLATLLLYMVLASLFNSFFQPIIVMLAQPLAVVGGIALLWLTGKSLNIYSMIGLVLLIGLVAKNSILLIDLTNQLRAKGKETNAALLEACPVRLRPVLMTSITLILALLPAALGLGAGSEENGPLAIAVIGGMISSTLLTLIVIPAAFSLSVRFIEKK